MELKTVELDIPEGSNVILGETHFIKTAEDLYEIMAGATPGVKFGVAFCEASGPCLIRIEGNDEEMKKSAEANALKVGAGHTFVIMMAEAFPINVLNSLKLCPEVCSIFCATANPVEVIVAETEQGRGILGVIDGSSPKGVETEKDSENRKNMLRRFGYKL
jgi:adenosine/AMP kinase